VHGITSLRISLPDFPWPPLDNQLALFVAPWRGMLEPHQVTVSTTDGRAGRTRGKTTESKR
jgi:hypothetical protein